MSDNQPTRREALRRLGGGAVLLGASGGAALLTLDRGSARPGQAAGASRPIDLRPEPRPGRPDVSVIRGGSPRDLVRAAIDDLGGLSRFIERGDRVLIKPNIGWDRIPLMAANTNPEVVAALVEVCRQAGASRVVVGDVSCNNPQRSLDRSGIGAAATGAGAEVVVPSRRLYQETRIGGEALDRWLLFQPVLECTKLINVPVAKTHTLAGFTGALKNWYGLLGGRRSQLHQSIHDSIADLAGFFRPTLTLIDAVRVMHRNGPTGGDVADTRRLDTVVASVDQVAADAYACGLVGIRPADLPYLARAARRGFGRSELGSLNVHEVDLG